MSLLTKTQANKGKGVTATGVQQRARRAAAQAGPLAASAGAAARKGVHHARTWTAPRLERTGHTLQDQVAPRMAAMLSATARRIEPAPPRRHRRWALMAAGLITAAGLSATAAYLLNRRNARATEQLAAETSPAAPAGGPGDAAGPAGSDVNGRVRTA